MALDDLRPPDFALGFNGVIGAYAGETRRPWLVSTGPQP